MSTAAGELAKFCNGLTWAHLSGSAKERTLEVVLDHLAVAIGGMSEPSSVVVRDYVLRFADSGAATVIGAGPTVPAPWAVLANGAAAHATELDDVTRESSLHPGAVVIPACLAVAEERGATATRFLEAVVAGYEVTMRVGNALDAASSYRRGFHPTSVAGIFGAATSASVLLGLSVDATTSAIGIAATQSSGSLEYLADGSWTKRLNPGWAAHSGVVAAELAAAGFRGPASALEGRLGVLHAYSDSADPDRLLAGLGDSLQIEHVAMKPYACCRYNHGIIDAMLQIREHPSFDIDRIAAIHLGILSGGWLLVAEPIERKQSPQNLVDAQFSAPFAAAAALTYGRADLAAFQTSSLSDSRVRRLMQLASCYRDDALDQAYPARWPAAARVVFDDGSELTAKVDYALGEPERPIPRRMILEKWHDLAGPALGSASDEIAEAVLDLATVADMADFGRRVRAGLSAADAV